MVKSKKLKLTIKQIENLIETNLSEAVITLVAGLKANDDEGYPDWSTRVVCAKALLNKKIPDVQRVIVRGDGENGRIVFEVIKHYDGPEGKD